MRNWSKWIIVFVAALFLLAACSSNDSTDVEDNGEGQDGTITVIVSDMEADEVFSEKEIDIEEGAILMDVMKENYDVDEEEGFINEIDGVGPEEGEQKAWIYSVNDEEALVGAHEYELSLDDEVLFDLQAWE